MSSLASTGFIVIDRGILVLRGDPVKLNAAAREISAAIAARAVLDPNKAMSALKLTDLAKSTLEASRDSDLALGAIKLVGSTAFGTGIAIFASPFVTPLGGAAVGFLAGKIYEELFDYARSQSATIDLSSDLPENWQKTTFPFDPDLYHVDGLPSVIDPTCNRNFQAAQNWVAPRDPLVLDLDNDGIEAVGINPSAPILFDMDGDGIKTATGWIKADDGMLVLDRNGNGLIDSGRELFGDATILTRGPRAGQTAANGYEALADLDINGDGAINSLDAAYASLRIWQDANQDGISQASELRTLSSLGIASLNVTGQASSVNLGNGNTQPFSGSFTRTSGKAGQAGTVALVGRCKINGFHKRKKSNYKPQNLLFRVGRNINHTHKFSYPTLRCVCSTFIQNEALNAIKK